jgi:hypothetical protein
MTGGEGVRQSLELLILHWDRLPVRVYQDGHWQSLFLSEIHDERLVANEVVRFLVSRHLREDAEAETGAPEGRPS